jgi:quinol-cytochrome oxidoreductase complex cytochrome b subunit
VILLVRPDADELTIAGLARSVAEMELTLRPIDGAKGRAFEVMGAERGRVLALRGAPGVEEILTRRWSLEAGEPVWPHVTMRLTILLLLLVAVLTLLTAFSPPGLGDAAEAHAPGTGEVEWYLRPLASILSLFPGAARWIGGVLVLLSWAVLLFWPFLDRADPATPRGRRAVLLMRVMGIALILLVVVLGLK